MYLENMNRVALFDSSNNFVEWVDNVLFDPDEVSREVDGGTQYNVYQQIPENEIDLPHNQRAEYGEDPIWDAGEEKPVLVMELVLKTGDDLAEAEIATTRDLRVERDRLLLDSDWRVTIALEKSEAISSDWSTYRQELRDLPATANIYSIVCPTAPE